jgi:osmotically-inducible protein OsmY
MLVVLERKESRPSTGLGRRRTGNTCAVLSLAVLAALVLPACAAGAEQSGAMPDSAITKAVELALDLDELVSAHLIDVETHDGIVTLSGTVDNILARDRSTAVAESIKGVRSVVNRIGVACIVRSDDVIAADVRNALEFDPVAGAYDVKVKVKDGVVTLEGYVDSWEDRRLAGYIAMGVKGVKDVDNAIDVTFAKHRPDDLIKAEIERKLALDMYVYEGFIDVKVEAGIVTLTGAVGGAAEKTEATLDSWVDGVVDVDNSGLEVQQWASEDIRKESRLVITSDADIKAAVGEALKYDPRTADFKIGVEVSGKVVTLTGEVDNLLAKASAGEDAQNTMGVVDVVNGIKVRLGVAPPGSGEITDNVKAALARDPILEKYILTVLARNQKVYLFGKVRTFCEKQRANEVASSVFGVVDVENDIEVNSVASTWSDERIKDNIEKRLAWSLFVDGSSIGVSVHNGVATLDGAVNSWRELRTAVEDAFDGGATAVNSQLSIVGLPGYYPSYQREGYNRPLP